MLPPSGAVESRGSSSAPIEELHPNRDQPRRSFDPGGIEELAQSIRELGVLEPILVRARAKGGFEIVAGERRWRAAQRAGLKDVPIFVHELTEAEAFEAALVENLQREDLNPIETARAFERLIEEHEHTQESVAARVGKDRSTVANALRLLKLPEEILAMVESGQLSEGHGRAVLGARDSAAMRQLAQAAIEKQWSVRETERQARAEGRAGSANGHDASSSPNANVRDLEDRLSRALGSRVRVVDKNGRGRLEVPYSSYDELDRLLAKFL